MQEQGEKEKRQGLILSNEFIFEVDEEIQHMQVCWESITRKLKKSYKFGIVTMIN